MRIEFLTQDDPLYVLPFFEEFICHYAGDFEIVQISSSPSMGNRRRTQMLKELTQLYGALGMTRLLARLITSRVLGVIRKKPAAGGYAPPGRCAQLPGGEPPSGRSPSAVRVRVIPPAERPVPR